MRIDRAWLGLEPDRHLGGAGRHGEEGGDEEAEKASSHPELAADHLPSPGAMRRRSPVH
jgi:hypothetical protein